tara:strand:- start:793 stop:2487 length:1695 start_codon:yes stop_codon:yes gene_type:complete
MLLQDKLREEGIQTNVHFGRDDTQKIKCPKCQPPHNPKDRPLSLTTEGGTKAMWNCHHCGYSGSLDTTKMKVVSMHPNKLSYQKDNLQNDFLDKYFIGRSISRETYQALKIYSSNDDKWICFPYNPKDKQADNIKFRTVDKQFKQTKNGRKSLYNYENIKDANEVIFVEGEIDVLSLYEVGYKNATTLPDGAPAKVAFKENDKRFSCLQTHPIKARKIILFVDKDGAGENLNKELLHRFGKDICWYVETPKDCKDANDVLTKHGAATLKRLVQYAKPYPVDGLYTVRNYTNEVLDLYNGNYAKPIEIGYPKLDQIYKILKGTFHVWTGIPNHGKSTVLDQFLVRIAKKHDWKFALFSPEHSTSMHIRRLAQIVTEKPFDKGTEDRMTTDELHAALDWVKEHFYFIETREHIPNIKKILEIAKQSCLKFGINGIIIDPYNEVDAKRSGNYREDEHIRDFISNCKRFARTHDVTVWVVAHPTKLPKSMDGVYEAPTAYDIAGASHWHNQSDAVVTVHRDFDDDSIKIITRKIREQGLYGNIGEVKFNYNNKKRIFEEKQSLPQGWD